MTQSVLVFGSSGQVATAISLFQNKQGFVTTTAGRAVCNIANTDEVFETVKKVRPDFVVNAAAYTAVDLAQHEPEVAFRINEAGAKNVAEAAVEVDAPLIHISTDYVFSGDAKSPYSELDETAPLNIYGRSKLAGEIAVEATHARQIILRTSWVYSPIGTNFVKTMLKLAADKDELSVVSDQFGNPTSADEIAGAIFSILKLIQFNPDKVQYGTYHFCGSVLRSWATFAEDIFDVSRSLGGPNARVIPISTRQYGSTTGRPAFSALDCSRFRSTFDYVTDPYKDSVRKVVSEILKIEK